MRCFAMAPSDAKKESRKGSIQIPTYVAQEMAASTVVTALNTLMSRKFVHVQESVPQIGARAHRIALRHRFVMGGSSR